MAGWLAAKHNGISRARQCPQLKQILGAVIVVLRAVDDCHRASPLPLPRHRAGKPNVFRLDSVAAPLGLGSSSMPSAAAVLFFSS
jgi:hypothetical protein